LNPTDPGGRLAGKAALITGAGSGIGAAIARLFADEGCKVALADTNQSAAEAGSQAICAIGGTALAVLLNVASDDSWDVCMRAVLDRWSRLDVLVNCAGIALSNPISETSLEEWRAVHAVNLDGVFLGTRAGIQAMVGSGGGSIINIASIAGLDVYPGAAAYASSKAAVIHFSKVAARECDQARNRVRINVVAPGGVRTPIWKSTALWKSLAKKSEGTAWRKLDPQNAFFQPEEIASSVLYLASDESRHVNGSVLVLNRLAAG
jgi:NAD(P)-dependent dehydrogenase (short-subunit alcohol dehydrogenase family)